MSKNEEKVIRLHRSYLHEALGSVSTMIDDDNITSMAIAALNRDGDIVLSYSTNGVRAPFTMLGALDALADTVRKTIPTDDDK